MASNCCSQPADINTVVTAFTLDISFTQKLLCETENLRNVRSAEWVELEGRESSQEVLRFGFCESVAHEMFRSHRVPCSWGFVFMN
ncbi:hypothetical protein NPIL_634421 [Nephila pilipes]|uniref:Uncharacterized protein n=1 Tax=Nephila pilipes TaxID=299642 RepID=A0A8X6IHF5_NEPPI|nr:hypothetical protein NPIL_634421 [Nephila pilipes]